MIQTFLRLGTAGSFLTLLLVMPRLSPFAAEQVPVADELERLAEKHGFSIRGLEQTDQAFGRVDGEELYLRLRRLLENFDHVIVQSSEGGVDRVIVLGEKVPFEPPPPPDPGDRPDAAAGGVDIVLETERRGTQHVVRVALEGVDGAKAEHELHLDTGADFLVLPQSLLSKLGIDTKALSERDMQTANGRVKARIGILPALWLGENRVAGVETAFVEDDKLGGNGLLGMSVVRRFKLTIDDDKNRITLSSKEPRDLVDGGDGGEGDQAAKGQLEQAEEVSAEGPGDKTP